MFCEPCQDRRSDAPVRHLIALDFGRYRRKRLDEIRTAHDPGKLPVRGKNYKIRFMTQVGTNPVRFVAFVNRMAGFPEGYAGYLENCIRRDLGFRDVPVSVEFRQSRKAAR